MIGPYRHPLLHRLHVTKHHLEGCLVENGDPFTGQHHVEPVLEGEQRVPDLAELIAICGEDLALQANPVGVPMGDERVAPVRVVAHHDGVEDEGALAQLGRPELMLRGCVAKDRMRLRIRLDGDVPPVRG